MSVETNEQPQPPQFPSYYRHVAVQAIDDAEGLRQRVVVLQAELARREKEDTAVVADLRRALEKAERTIVELRGRIDRHGEASASTTTSDAGHVPTDPS